MGFGRKTMRASIARVIGVRARHRLRAVASAVCLLGLTACATTQDPAALEANDPYEPANRWAFGVSQGAEKYFMRPAAETYNFILLKDVRDMIRNFMNNLDTPVILANDLLQGEMDRAGVTLGRFAINSTAGIGGLFDMAKFSDLDRHSEDFGQTMATWGVASGPYLYVPLMGPSNPRDGIGLAGDLAFDPFTYVNWGQLLWIPYARQGVNLLDQYSRGMDALDEIERTSLDYYSSIRSLSQQRRKSAIQNGRESFDDLPSFDNGE
jgi:phospholipid-binding lipoprotein MlaA